jgi:hypothetical protein
MAFQPELPFFASDTGFQRWKRQVDAYRTELERKLGIPLGSKVRLTLADFEHPFTGILEMVAGTKEANPRLRLRDLRFDFALDEITSLHRLD